MSETVSADSPRAPKAVGSADVGMEAHLVTSQVPEQGQPTRRVTRYLVPRRLRHTARRRREASWRCSAVAAFRTMQTALTARTTTPTRLRDLRLAQQQQAAERLPRKINPLAARHNCRRRKPSNRPLRSLPTTAREISESLAQVLMTSRPSVTAMLSQSKPPSWETTLLRQ